MKKVHIIGGGTVFHVRPHLAISATAYGGTAKKIADECQVVFGNRGYKIITHLTKMASAGKSTIETNYDVKLLIEEICLHSNTKIIFLPVALCDFEGYIVENDKISNSGKDQPRLKSRSGNFRMELIKAEKLIGEIKSKRPDIHLVGFKTTSNVSENETIELARKLQNDVDCDLVFANDIYKRLNVIIGKSNYISEFYKDRNKAIKLLVGLVDKIS